MNTCSRSIRWSLAGANPCSSQQTPGSSSGSLRPAPSEPASSSSDTGVLTHDAYGGERGMPQSSDNHEQPVSQHPERRAPRGAEYQRRPPPGSAASVERLTDFDVATCLKDRAAPGQVEGRLQAVSLDKDVAPERL